ncbi:hypothetical protein BaRGS_00038173 [Batillaria attramentaria]|uniref:Uncharacterized protein n=1 Tax=Batillaria attramentaria TaxID=370345 RepID=A0ABD0J731_9CAEN
MEERAASLVLQQEMSVKCWQQFEVVLFEQRHTRTCLMCLIQFVEPISAISTKNDRMHCPVIFCPFPRGFSQMDFMPFIVPRDVCDGHVLSTCLVITQVTGRERVQCNLHAGH